jgi:hypothetical protein
MSTTMRLSSTTAFLACLCAGSSGCLRAAGDQPDAGMEASPSSSTGSRTAGSSGSSGGAVSGSTSAGTSSAEQSSGSSSGFAGTSTSGSSSGGASGGASSATSSGSTRAPLFPCPELEAGSPCADGGTCEFAPEAACYSGTDPSASCQPSGSVADGGDCSAADGGSGSSLCPECEVCSPREPTFPIGDCRLFVEGGLTGFQGTCPGTWADTTGILPVGWTAAPVVIAQGLAEDGIDLYNRAMYPVDSDGGCAIGYDPGLFLVCSDYSLDDGRNGKCLGGAQDTGWGSVCGCPSQCHYGHCVLPSNSDGSCPDAGKPTVEFQGFCYQSCEVDADCTGSLFSYVCSNGLCMNPDAGP